MKKFLCLMLSIVMMLSICPVVQGTQVGSVIGTVYNTDIVAYINNYAIPSFAANGTSVVIAEDLRNFGFDIMWDGSARTLSIARNNKTYVTSMTVQKTGAPSTKFADLLYTDIKVYAEGIQIPSYAINGYTMIPLESLTMFGSCNWVSEQRALKLWIDGLHVREYMQTVFTYVTPVTQSYGNSGWSGSYSTSNSYNPSPDGRYYRTPTGKRYHLDPNCGGKNSYPTTNISGLTPCKKCAQ